MNGAELLARLKDSEDNFVERKLQSVATWGSDKEAVTSGHFAPG